MFSRCQNSSADRSRPLPCAFGLLTAFVFGLVSCVAADGVTASDARDNMSVRSAAANTSTTAASGRGRMLFLHCRACHSLVSEDGHRVGPNLAGLFGSVAGTREGFVYSDAMASSKLVWTDAALDEFLARPNDNFEGTKMAFVGLPDSEDRRQLIAYIRSQLSQ